MKIEVPCTYCAQLFLIEKKSFNQNQRRGWSNYCSRRCANQAKITALTMICASCGKSIPKTNYQIRRSQSSNYYCSRSCAIAKNNSLHRQGAQHPNYVSGEGIYRAKALQYYGSACTVCGYNIERVLEVHHRDGNRKNNDIANLDVLCPTHHTEYQVGIRSYSSDKPELPM